MRYKELEVVPVPEAVPDLGIEAGFPGTVEHVYQGGYRADLEISREDGETIGFVTVDSRPKPHVVAHYLEAGGSAAAREARRGLVQNVPTSFGRKRGRVDR